MTAFYNEIDPFAAQWLRNLVDAGHIAPGVVDERDIRDIAPEELAEFTQCHFFAGIGVWSYALRQAGWPDNVPVWTGSCPCQPFSPAGKGDGFLDERHLFPDWYHLIAECRPATIFGEQVASEYGLDWYDLVQADLEGAGYAVGAADMCAAGVGAPHIRQRLWFVAERLANPNSIGQQGSGFVGRSRDTTAGADREIGRTVDVGRGLRLADIKSVRQFGRGGADGADGPQTGNNSQSSGLADRNGSTDPTNGFWRNADWLGCRDGKWRPVESGTFPLAHGVAGKVGRLRAYGNAIVAPAAQTFIEAYLECVQPPIEAAAKPSYGRTRIRDDRGPLINPSPQITQGELL